MSWSRNTQRETWRLEPETTRRGKRKNKNANLVFTSTSYQSTRSCKLKLWNSPHIFYFFQGYILIRHTGKVVEGWAWPVSRWWGEEEVERACKRRNGETEWKIEARLWRFDKAGGRWEGCKMKDSEREGQRNRLRGVQVRGICDQMVLWRATEISWPLSIMLQSRKQYIKKVLMRENSLQGTNPKE